jgi:5,10-methenyltetrahydromethanopterin hydrogenase
MRDETPQEVIDDIIKNSNIKYARAVYTKNLKNKFMKQKKEEEIISLVSPSPAPAVSGQIYFNFDKDLKG